MRRLVLPGQWALPAALLLLGWPTAPAAETPVDINGAWTSSPGQCGKIFVRGKQGLYFSRVADQYGSGFIVDGRKIKGRIARCDVKRRKDDGKTIHLIASCAYDVMLSEVQVSLQVLDQNKLARIFPGLPEMQTSYERCTLN